MIVPGAVTFIIFAFKRHCMREAGSDGNRGVQARFNGSTGYLLKLTKTWSILVDDIIICSDTFRL